MKKLLLIPLALALFGFTGCSTAQLDAVLTNAPAVITDGLATASDLYASYAAAQQSISGKPITASSLLTAANAAGAGMTSPNLTSAVSSLGTALNQMQTELAAAGASPAQIAAAQVATVTAAQVTTKAIASPAGVTTAMFRIHYNSFTRKLVVVATD